MPVENERKYVLWFDDSIGKLNELKHDFHYDLIEQGYLTENDRLRKKTSHEGKVSYVFTFKKKVNGRLIEIEQNISEFDFEQLWTVTRNKIFKTRIKMQYESGLWELDFFHIPDTYGKEHYLTMAEIELPDGVMLPSSVPEIVDQNLIYLVEPTDHRFINSNMVYPNKIKRIVKELRKKNGKTIQPKKTD